MSISQRVTFLESYFLEQETLLNMKSVWRKRYSIDTARHILYNRGWEREV